MKTKAEKEEEEFEQLHETLLNGNQGVFREAMQKYNKKKFFRFIKFVYEDCKDRNYDNDFIETMNMVFKQIDLAFEGYK